jgi:hypothetical protein
MNASKSDSISFIVHPFTDDKYSQSQNGTGYSHCKSKYDILRVVTGSASYSSMRKRILLTISHSHIVSVARSHNYYRNKNDHQ